MRLIMKSNSGIANNTEEINDLSVVQLDAVQQRKRPIIMPRCGNYLGREKAEERGFLAEAEAQSLFDPIGAFRDSLGPNPFSFSLLYSIPPSYPGSFTGTIRTPSLLNRVLQSDSKLPRKILDGRWATTCGAFYGCVLRTRAKNEISTAHFFDSHWARPRNFPVECSAKRLRKSSKPRKGAAVRIDDSLLGENKSINSAGGSSSEVDNLAQEDDDARLGGSAARTPAAIPSRDSVLQACIVTSGSLGALGAGIRQVSHIASVEGLPIADCTKEVTFGFEIWHLELIIGLLVLISSSRYLLLKAWPDFAESSAAANQQVLTSLEPLDYLVVAFLPGISEELLFRGALIPVIGLNWTGILVVASIFGALHLSGGRKYSFAIWATFVGFLYGWATVASGSVVAPMAAHALNNLVGGILWRYDSSSSK